MQYRTLAVIGLTICLASCATTPTTGPAMLPFHVAVIPVDIGVDIGTANSASSIEEGNESALSLALDSAGVTTALVEAMNERFCRVTLLPTASDVTNTEENYQFWVAEARKHGADLILDARLTYEPKIHTSLNDSFWLNLPLFIIGGPFNWFVNDRSYYVSVRLEGFLFNTDGAGEIPPPNQATEVQELRTQMKEVTLDFIDRGDRVVPYLLTIVVPSGFVSAESDAVVPELHKALASTLAADVGQQIQSNSRALIYWPRGVDFAPVDVRVTEDRKALTGQFVLRLGEVTRLRFLRYRTDPTAEYENFEELGDGTRVPATGNRGQDQLLYDFRIPIEGPDVSWIQIQVAQQDVVSTSRTFTFPIPPADPPKR